MFFCPDVLPTPTRLVVSLVSGKRPDTQPKGQTMTTDKNKTGGDEIEFIDANEVEFVRRGRVSSIPADVIETLSRLPVGKAWAIKKYALDANSPDYKSEKNRVGATIRNACAQAGLGKISLRWSPTGVPQVINRGK